MANEKKYKGYNGTLILTDTGVIIKRGIKGYLLGGGIIRGDKSIPYSSIMAVQLKKAGLTAGYIQLSLIGVEAKQGLFKSAKDENSINFYHSKNGKFEEAKNLIEQRMGKANQVANSSSNADEIKKLSALKDEGVITEEEFTAKKKQLLGL